MKKEPGHGSKLMVSALFLIFLAMLPAALGQSYKITDSLLEVMDTQRSDIPVIVHLNAEPSEYKFFFCRSELEKTEEYPECLVECGKDPECVGGFNGCVATHCPDTTPEQARKNAVACLICEKRYGQCLQEQASPLPESYGSCTRSCLGECLTYLDVENIPDDETLKERALADVNVITSRESLSEYGYFPPGETLIVDGELISLDPYIFELNAIPMLMTKSDINKVAELNFVDKISYGAGHELFRGEIQNPRPTNKVHYLILIVALIPICYILINLIIKVNRKTRF